MQIRCKPHANEYMEVGFFFSQPLNFIWHNCSTRHTCPELAAFLLPAEIVSGLERSLVHSSWGLLPPTCCPRPLPLVPPPHSETEVDHRCIHPCRPSPRQPVSHPPNKVTPQPLIYLHFCLPSPGGFLATWDEPLPFS